MLIPVCTLLLFVATCILKSQENGSPASYRSTLRFIVDHRGDSLEAESQKSTRIRYGTQRSEHLEELREFEAFFNPITSLRALYNGNRLSNRRLIVTTTSMSDAFLSDQKENLIRIPVVPIPGDSLEYTVERDWPNVNFIPPIAVPNVPLLEKYEVIVDHPNDVHISLSVYDARHSVRFTVDSSRKGRKVLRIDSIPYQPHIPFFPFNDVLCYVVLNVQHNKALPGHSAPASLATWYTSWFPQEYDLSASQRDRLLAQCTSAKYRADSMICAFDFIRNNIRYVSDVRGIGAYVPRRPSQVMDQLYGDCKDRAHLLSSMYRTLGVPSGIALVSDQRAEVVPGYSNLRLFYHAVTWYVMNGDTLLIDPTSRFSTFDHLTSDMRDRPVLLVDGSRSRWTRSATMDSAFHFRITSSFSDDHLTSVPSTVLLGTDAISHVRYQRTFNPASKHEEVVQRQMESLLHGLKIESLHLTDTTSDVWTAQCVLDYSNLVTVRNGKIFVPMKIGGVISSTVLQRLQDKLPIELEPIADIDIILQFANKRSTQGDTTVMVEGPRDVRHQVQCYQEGNQSVVRLRTKVGRRWFAGEDRSSILEFVQSYLRLRTTLISLQ